jgi:uncharacterized membrane protein YphA (DoxX/SURF4 family)
MNALLAATLDWARSIARAWDRFWFTPDQPHTLALIRILGGAMLFYTHLVWTIDLEAFLGPHAWLTRDTVGLMNQTPEGRIYVWSYLAWTDSPAVLWTLHLAALVVLAMLTLGLFTRITSILAFVITLSYCHRLTGSLFGLDQVNAFVATYLMLGSCGAVWSLDRWRAARRGEATPPQANVGTNVAIRLLQVHMCVIYLFGGISKMRGPAWWDGSALWYGLANLEYQSLDMTWTVHAPWLLALLTHITVFWETFYCFLIWPRLTRPIWLALAVGVHLGIALCLGMVTFGLAMIIANLAFVPPDTVRAVVAWLASPLARLASAHGDKMTPSSRHTPCAVAN